MSKIFLRKETIINILNSIIKWYTGVFNEDGESIKINVSSDGDVDFMDLNNNIVESLLGVHQDIQAEYTDGIVYILDKIISDGTDVYFPADILSMLLSYYKDGEGYEKLSERFSLPIYECLVRICIGERIIFENFDIFLK